METCHIRSRPGHAPTRETVTFNASPEAAPMRKTVIPVLTSAASAQGLDSNPKPAPFIAMLAAANGAHSPAFLHLGQRALSEQTG